MKEAPYNRFTIYLHADFKILSCILHAYLQPIKFSKPPPIQQYKVLLKNGMGLAIAPAEAYLQPEGLHHYSPNHPHQ